MHVHARGVAVTTTLIMKMGGRVKYSPRTTPRHLQSCTSAIWKFPTLGDWHRAVLSLPVCQLRGNEFQNKDPFWRLSPSNKPKLALHTDRKNSRDIQSSRRYKSELYVALPLPHRIWEMSFHSCPSQVSRWELPLLWSCGVGDWASGTNSFFFCFEPKHLQPIP